MLKLRGISHSSSSLGSDSPQSNNRKGDSIHPRERPNVEHSIFWLFKATTAYTSACTDAGAALAPALARCWGDEPGYATGNPPEDYGQILGGYSFPWMLAVD